MIEAAGRTILFEASNLGSATGTGIATYARTLAGAAGRLGFATAGLFDVARPLDRRQRQLNEVLAFDAVEADEPVSPLALAWRYLNYPFNALGGLRPVELARSGLVIGPATAALGAFGQAYAATRLIDNCMAHFKIYGRSAEIRLPRPPSLFHATHPVPLAVKGVPNIVTIHDLVPLRLPYATLDDKRYFYKLVHHLARTADHIVTVSEHSRRDIIELLQVDERRVTNTWQAVEIPEEIARLTDDDVAPRLEALFGLGLREYYLFCGAIEPKKNVSRLLDAYAASGSKRPLILAGAGGWQNSEELRKIDDDRFRSFRIDGDRIRRARQVHRLDYLARDQLLLLMRGARALLFPSLYEGFGLPAAEAMALGTPVLTANVSSLPEVTGDAALLVDPYSIEDIGRGIAALEADGDLHRELSQRGREQANKFSPNAYEVGLGRLYESL
jgi:glycosyltransferase involved in cell wall biosynthesis